LKLKNFFFILSIVFSNNLYSTEINVINLDYIIENNKYFKLLITNIENDQLLYSNIFNKREQELQLQINEINDLKLILDTVEIDKRINEYNQNLNKFQNDINNFNNHYENQIIGLKNDILNKLLEVLKNYSIDKQIDLILDSNSYILSNSSIDITNIILEKLNTIKFEINFEKYK